MPYTDADAFRIEPVLSDHTLATGLRMSVADPAWMLSRQLLFGELAGEDAGSPAAARLWMETSRLTRYAVGAPAGTGTLIGPDSAPLEARIENEWQPRGEPSPQIAVLAGRHYLRELRDAGVSGLNAYQAALVAKYPLPPGGTGPLAALAAGKVPDGQKVYAALDAALRRASTPALPPDPPVTGQDVTPVTVASNRFLAWYDAITGRSLPEAGAWSEDRLEYQMSLGAPTSRGELALTATEYDSGRLDWYAFDLADGASVGAARDAGALPAYARSVLPAPVTFRGMPAPRLWEFEDAAVDLGAVQAGPEDLAAMLVVEFALRYGNDFFLVPLPLTVGSVSRVGALVVADTFGVRILVRPAAEVDGGIRVFEHEVPGGGRREPSLVVFPAAADGPESAPLEEVVLARDEGADVCWAIEKTALGRSGAPEDRAAAAAARTSSGGGGGYRLRTAVADHWYPLLADAATLRLGRVRALPGDPPQSAPWGRVLGELAGVAVPGEEVTRDGHRIVRVWRHARGADGIPYLWAGRRAGPAAETGASGLRFDLAD